MEPGGTQAVTFLEWDSPIGTLLIAASAGSTVRVALPGHDREAVLRSLCERFGSLPEEVAIGGDDLQADANHRCAGRPEELAVAELRAYFDGAATGFTVAVDPGMPDGFRRSVLGETARIPFGETTSYAGIATRAGNPRAFRAAGSALASNPVALIVPCHRVIRSDGAPGRFGGGSDLKRHLLDHERTGRH